MLVPFLHRKSTEEDRQRKADVLVLIQIIRLFCTYLRMGD